MITSLHFLVVEVVMFQIFSYFAYNAIEASLIVVHVECIIGLLEPIAVKIAQPISRQVLQHNAQEQQKKEQDVEIRQPIQMVAAICTKFYKSNS